MKMRRLWKVLIIVAVVLVAIVITGWLTIDWMAKKAIMKAGSDALGVEVKVDSVSLHLLAGEAVVKGIVVANPPDCKTQHLMKTGTLNAAVKIGSLFTNTVVISKFEVDDLDLNIEQPKLFTFNFNAILDHIKAAAPKDEKPKEDSGKKFQVDHIAFRNTVAHLQTIPGSEGSFLDIKVPEIVMDNVTSDNASGVALPELVRRLIPALLMAVIDKAKGVVPDAKLLEGLSSDVASTTKALGQGAANLVKQAGGEAGKLLEGVGGAAKGLDESLKKGVGNPLDLLGGKKKPETSDKPK
jgi:hypothetical protein